MDMELRQMEIRNYMTEQVFPAWEAGNVKIGLEAEDGMF